MIVILLSSPLVKCNSQAFVIEIKMLNRVLFPEMEQLQALLAQHQRMLRVETISSITYQGFNYPVQAIRLGSENKRDPAICFVAGVHGVERIGSQVVLSFMHNLFTRLAWDQQLQNLLLHMQLLFIPIVNPVGMLLQRRANAEGVDLMRNSPAVAECGATWMVGGQRLSARLPWYRGAVNQPMQQEAAALCQFVQQHLYGRPFSLVLDCHSGFGHADRIWFPYAKSAAEPIDDIAWVYRLREIFFASYPHQNYLFEPQTKHYRCHGDLWDYCYQQSLSWPGIFLPLTLEMGSWRWLKKNPLQVFSGLGLYHPMKPHRVQRVMRRHLVLMEFLINVSYSWQSFDQVDGLASAKHAARKLWY